MRKIGIVGLLLGLALCSGCVRMMVPILDDKDLISDSSLAGEWIQEGNSQQSLRIEPPDSEKHYRIEFRDDKGKSGKFIGQIGRLGELMVAEIGPADLPDEWSDTYKGHFATLTSVFVVTATRPALKFRGLDADWLKEYLKAHPDELTIAPSDENLVTSGAEAIRAFLLKHWKDEGALSEEAVYVRPKDKLDIARF